MTDSTLTAADVATEVTAVVSTVEGVSAEAAILTAPEEDVAITIFIDNSRLSLYFTTSEW